MAITASAPARAAAAARRFGHLHPVHTTNLIPEIDEENCTGCGKCEKACVLEEAAIKVFPMHLAKGELGHHYRWGWEEKQKAGRSLVAPDEQHRYNLPEGQSYDYGGEGLQFEEGGSEVPFGSDPLSTLNRGRERQP